MDNVRLDLKAYSVTRSRSNNTLTMSSPRLTLSKLREWLPDVLTESDIMSNSTNACKVAEEFDASVKDWTCINFQNYSN
jgi:hypothetical protein